MNSDPTKLTATDVKVQGAVCWILGMHAAFTVRGFPSDLKGLRGGKARAEFHEHVNTALELVRNGATYRGPLVLYAALLAYVEQLSGQFHAPLYPAPVTNSEPS